MTRKKQLINIKRANTTYAFTLIEILVVLIIVAIILMVAIMAFGDFGQSRKQHLAVIQLQQSMQAARAQAILQPTVLGLVFTKDGYRYYRYAWNTTDNRYEWSPLADDVLSQPDAFSTATSINFIPVNKSFHADTTGAHPLIDFLPSGAISPFRTIIVFSDQQRFTIRSTGSGEVTIE